MLKRLFLCIVIILIGVVSLNALDFSKLNGHNYTVDYDNKNIEFFRAIDNGYYFYIYTGNDFRYMLNNVEQMFNLSEKTPADELVKEFLNSKAYTYIDDKTGSICILMILYVQEEACYKIIVVKPV